MKRKIILGLGAAGTALAMLPLFAAFEAHVINVTATIENALSVPFEVDGLSFGTVFPQQEEDLPFDIGLSGSFLDRDGNTHANRVAYTIRQKPKCGLPILPTPTGDPVTYSDFTSVSEDDQGNFVCPGNADTDTDGDGDQDTDTDGPGYVALPLLCPYLSKHEQTQDPVSFPENDSAGIFAFHGLPGPWNMSTTLATAVFGLLDRVVGDNSDTWNIDLKVPCFRDDQIDNCAQDWKDFVEEHGEEVGDPLGPPDPDDYVADPNLEHELFGCDLWIETTAIDPQCSDGIDNDGGDQALVDSADPGCHSDNNEANAASYEPWDDDEEPADFD